MAQGRVRNNCCGKTHREFIFYVILSTQYFSLSWETRVSFHSLLSTSLLLCQAACNETGRYCMTENPPPGNHMAPDFPGQHHPPGLVLITTSRILEGVRILMERSTFIPGQHGQLLDIKLFLLVSVKSMGTEVKDLLVAVLMPRRCST